MPTDKGRSSGGKARASGGAKTKVRAAVRRVARAAKEPVRAAKSRAAKKRPAMTVSRMPASGGLAGTRAPRKRAQQKRSPVDDYVLGVPAPFRAILGELRRIVRVAEPAATEAFKWGQPVFELNGPMAWMKAFRTHVGFGFFRGAELSDPTGLLEGTGKGMRHVKLTSAGRIPVVEIEAFVRAAAALNRQ